MKINEFLKIEHPIFSTTIPSTKQVFKYRPIVAKEEKILLIAKMSDDETEIFNAIYQIVNNCSFTDTNLSKLTVFDLEYLFLKIRASSISEIIQQSYLDKSDNQTYNFNIKVDDIKVINLDNDNLKIMLSEDAGLLLKYPTADLYLDSGFFKSGSNSDDLLIYYCIDKFFTKDDVKSIDEFNKDDIIEWISSLNLNHRKLLDEFVANIPKLYYEINYRNTLGEDRVIKLTTLSDFFMLH